jgi:hypothetical protein
VPRISYSKYSSSLPLVRFFDYLIPCSFDSRHSPLFIRSLWCIYDAHLCSGMNGRAGESLSLISHSHIIWHPLTGPLVSILGIPLYMVPLHLLGCTHLVLIHMPAQQRVPSSSPTFSLFPHCSHCLMARVLIPIMYIYIDMLLLVWTSRESLMYEYNNLSFSLPGGGWCSSRLIRPDKVERMAGSHSMYTCS